MLRSAKKLPREPLDLLRTFFKKYEDQKWKNVGDLSEAVLKLRNDNGDLKLQNRMLNTEIRLLAEGAKVLTEE